VGGGEKIQKGKGEEGDAETKLQLMALWSIVCPAQGRREL